MSIRQLKSVFSGIMLILIVYFPCFFNILHILSIPQRGIIKSNGKNDNSSETRGIRLVHSMKYTTFIICFILCNHFTLSFLQLTPYSLYHIQRMRLPLHTSSVIFHIDSRKQITVAKINAIWFVISRIAVRGSSCFSNP